jgi:hypothetical protein
VPLVLLTALLYYQKPLFAWTTLRFATTKVESYFGFLCLWEKEGVSCALEIWKNHRVIIVVP